MKNVKNMLKTHQNIQKHTKMHSVTDGPTDGRTDRVTYRVACTRLKMTNVPVVIPLLSQHLYYFTLFNFNHSEGKVWKKLFRAEKALCSMMSTSSAAGSTITSSSTPDKLEKLEKLLQIHQLLP